MGVFGCWEFLALSSWVSMFFVALMNDRLRHVQLGWLWRWLDQAREERHTLGRIQKLEDTIAGYRQGLRVSYGTATVLHGLIFIYEFSYTNRY
jgi:hypothetical protein